MADETIDSTGISDLDAKLAEIEASVPELFRPIVAVYGPRLAALGIERLKAWYRLIQEGKDAEAYQEILVLTGEEDLIAQLVQSNIEMDSLNEANAATVAMQKKLAWSVCQVLAGIVLAIIGL